MTTLIGELYDIEDRDEAIEEMNEPPKPTGLYSETFRDYDRCAKGKPAPSYLVRAQIEGRTDGRQRQETERVEVVMVGRYRPNLVKYDEISMEELLDVLGLTLEEVEARLRERADRSDYLWDEAAAGLL